MRWMPLLVAVALLAGCSEPNADSGSGEPPPPEEEPGFHTLVLAQGEPPTNGGWQAIEVNATAELSMNVQLFVPDTWRGCVYTQAGNLILTLCGDGFAVVAFGQEEVPATTALGSGSPVHFNVTFPVDPGTSLPVVWGQSHEGVPAVLMFEISSESPFTTGREASGPLLTAWSPRQLEHEGYVQVGRVMAADKVVGQLSLPSRGAGTFFVMGETHRAALLRNETVVWEHQSSAQQLEPTGSIITLLEPGTYTYRVEDLAGSGASVGYTAIEFPPWANVTLKTMSSPR